MRDFDTLVFGVSCFLKSSLQREAGVVLIGLTRLLLVGLLVVPTLENRDVGARVRAQRATSGVEFFTCQKC